MVIFHNIVDPLPRILEEASRTQSNGFSTRVYPMFVQQKIDFKFVAKKTDSETETEELQCQNKHYDVSIILFSNFSFLSQMRRKYTIKKLNFFIISI